MIPGPERPANFETYYRSIRDTRLSKVFVNYPWNTGRNAWPRVALVVEEEPIGGTGVLGYMQGGDKIKDRCWRLRARLWTGPAASQDIAPFNWCLSEMRFNVSYNDVALWGLTPATSMAEHNTGPNRTLGPNPPAILAPRFHYADGSHSDTIMLGNILLDMSFSLGVPDGRVWIVDGTKDSFPGVATGVASDTTTRTAIDSNTKNTKEQRSAKPSANSYMPAVEIKQGADNLKQTLEGMPYTSEGNGAVIYVFEFFDCPSAQRRYKDWKGKLEGVELRHFFYSTNQRTANETADLALSRDINDYDAYMEHKKTAPDARKTNQSMEVFNSIIGPILNIIIPTLHKNGWTDRNLVSPNYFWEVDGKWYSDSGHGAFESIMNMVKGSSKSM